MDFKQFILSGKTIITDTLAPKSEPVKAPKSMRLAPDTDNTDPLKNLIKRCKDEKVKKADIIIEFLKIIEREEAKI